MTSSRLLRRGVAALIVLLLVTAGCGSVDNQPAGAAPTSAPPTGPVGAPLTTSDIKVLAAQFTDNPLTGGQQAPRLYRWVNDQVAIFLQFDNPDIAEATALRYIGVSVKG